MRRSNKMQLISDRSPRRLVSAGTSSPEGNTSESQLVEFLKFYTRLHTDDICAQRVDPSNLVAWVFVDGAWQVRRGIEPPEDTNSWCQVYLTATLGLDPVQYERAKRELFTSNDGLSGVYRHKTRPAHALVYRPSRGLSTASIAAITAGSTAAVAGIGSLAWRQFLKNKTATPPSTLDSDKIAEKAVRTTQNTAYSRDSEQSSNDIDASQASTAEQLESVTTISKDDLEPADAKLSTEGNQAVLKLATDYAMTMGRYAADIGQCAASVGFEGAKTAGQCVRKGAGILEKYAQALGYTSVADAGQCAVTCVASAGFKGVKKLGQYTTQAGYDVLSAFWNYVVKNMQSDKDPLMKELKSLLDKERAKETTGEESDSNYESALENIQFAVTIYQSIAEKLKRNVLPLDELRDLLKLRELFGTDTFDPFDHALNQIYQTFKDHDMYDQLMRVLIEHDASENRALLESIPSGSLTIDYIGGLQQWVDDLQELLKMVENLKAEKSNNVMLGSEYNRTELEQKIKNLIKEVEKQMNKT